MKIRSKRAWGMALAAVVASTGLVGFTAGPASAAWSDCPSGYLCAWTGTNATGTMGKVQYNNTNLLQYNAFNNARSVYNNGASCSVTIFTGVSYTGTSVNLPRKTGYANLYNDNRPFYLNIASNRWC